MATGFEIVNPGISSRSGNLNADVVPSSATYGTACILQDVNGQRLGEMAVSSHPDGTIYLEIFAVRPVNGSEAFNGIKFGIKNDGTLVDDFPGSSKAPFLDALDSGLQNVTAGDDFVSADALKCRKFGKVVSVYGVRVKIQSGTTGWAHIGTLPSGYRPSSYAVYSIAAFGAASSIAEFRVDGKVMVSLPSGWSGSDCWFTVTFITN